MSSLRPACGRFSQKSSCAALTTPVIYPLLQPQQRVTKLRAFSSGGERFPDTEEVTSSNLVTPTTKSARRRRTPAARFLLRAQAAACHSPPSPMALTQWFTRGEKPDSAPKRHGYRGYGSNLLPYPGFCGGARRSRGSLASPNVSRPFLVRVSPASGEKRPRFGRVASWSRFFAALRTPRRLLPDNVLRGVP